MAIGEFYFAYADEGETFNSVTHAVNDEEVLSFRFVHQEGDFAQLEVDIRNPRIGLLNVGRARWAFLSFHHEVDGVVCFFYGRIIGVPTNLFDEVVTVSYLARPEDYVDLKAALADTLKVAPFWDEIFIAKDRTDDPDAALESRAAMWYIDPVTHTVSISSVIAGEDGTVELDEDEFFVENFSLSLNQSPSNHVIVKGSVSWDQTLNSFKGSPIDVMPKIMPSFPLTIPGVGPPVHLVSSFTFKGLQSSWPKPGAKINGGYIVRGGELEDVSFLAVPQIELDWYFANQESPFDPPVLPAALPQGSIVFVPKVTGKWWSGETAGFDIQVEVVFAALGLGKGTLTLDYDVVREYTENLTIELKTSTQPIVTEDQAPILISINGNKVSDYLKKADGDFAVPIGDVRLSRFFVTTRGRQAIKYLLAVARATLAIKSRAVEISFELPFSDGLEFTLRKNALIHNPRLPGGEAAGKIISIAHTLSGDEGAAITKITMACCVGNGETAYTSTVGEPQWAVAEWAGPDYQVFENSIELIDPSISDLAFTIDTYTPNDDGIDGTRIRPRDVIKNVVVQNPSNSQRAALGPLISQIGDTQAINTILQEFFTQISLTMHNLEQGPFETDVTITVEDLIIPKQIDIEAAT